MSGIAFIALPVSVAIAVLQYHLYDLDVVVKKALVAGALVLLVIGAYAAVVGLLGVVTSGNEAPAPCSSSRWCSGSRSGR